MIILWPQYSWQWQRRSKVCVCVCGASFPVIIINTSDRLAHKETNKVMLAYLHIFPSEATQRFILFYIHLWCILPTLLWTIKLHMDTVQIQSSSIFSSNNDHKIQSVQLAWGKFGLIFNRFPHSTQWRRHRWRKRAVGRRTGGGRGEG